VYVLGGPAGGGCLGGVPLCLTQVGDGLDQRGKAGDERHLRAGSFTAEPCGRQQLGRLAQPVAG